MLDPNTRGPSHNRHRCRRRAIPRAAGTRRAGRRQQQPGWITIKRTRLQRWPWGRCGGGSRKFHQCACVWIWCEYGGDGGGSWHEQWHGHAPCVGGWGGFTERAVHVVWGCNNDVGEYPARTKRLFARSTKVPRAAWRRRRRVAFFVARWSRRSRRWSRRWRLRAYGALSPQKSPRLHPGTGHQETARLGWYVFMYVLYVCMYIRMRVFV